MNLSFVSNFCISDAYAYCNIPIVVIYVVMMYSILFYNTIMYFKAFFVTSITSFHQGIGMYF